MEQDRSCGRGGRGRTAYAVGGKWGVEEVVWESKQGWGGKGRQGRLGKSWGFMKSEAGNRKGMVWKRSEE